MTAHLMCRILIGSVSVCIVVVASTVVGYNGSANAGEAVSPQAFVLVDDTSDPVPPPDFSPDKTDSPSASIPQPIRYLDLVPLVSQPIVLDAAGCAADFAPGGYFVVKGVKYVVTKLIPAGKTGYVIGKDLGSGKTVEAVVEAGSAAVWSQIPYSECVQASFDLYQMLPQGDVSDPSVPDGPAPVPEPVPAPSQN